MAKDRAHDPKRVTGSNLDGRISGPLTGKGKPADIIKGAQDIRTVLQKAGWSSSLKAAHIEKRKPPMTIDEYEEKYT